MSVLTAASLGKPLVDGATASGTVVAKTDRHIADSTSRRHFAIVERASLERDVDVGPSITVTQRGERASVTDCPSRDAARVNAPARRQHAAG